jgi:hypothetical protein
MIFYLLKIFLLTGAFAPVFFGYLSALFDKRFYSRVDVI